MKNHDYSATVLTDFEMEKPPTSGAVLRDFRLTAIRFVADAVNRTLDLREIADNAMDAVLAVTRMDAGAMYRWVEDDAALHLYAWRGLTEAFMRQVMVIRRGDDPLVDAVLGGTTQVVDDFRVTVGGPDRDPVSAGFGCAVLCPIMAQGKIVGLLVLGAYRTQHFEPETLDMIQVIANQIGIGVTNAQLLEDLEEKNKLLRLMMEEAHHRIKNNLQMVSGLLQLELAAAEGDLAQRLHHAISQIQAIAQVHNLLSEEMPDQVDTRVLIRIIVETMMESISSTDATPQVELELGNLWLDSSQAVPLALIVNELSANSFLHGHPPAGEPLRLFIQCVQQDQSVCLTVRDNGGGYPETIASDGQGMDIVRQLGQINLRGELFLTNRDNGAYVVLRFPIAPEPPST
ncbi:MAG: GAF domain-containing protein [Verrucomicrobia bacterium]|nr:GAF domain-containing protein [Verrucomicrobiota bacterium]